MRFSTLFVCCGLLPGALAARAAELGSDPYIKALFPFAAAISTVSRLQPGEPIPAGNRLAPGQLPCPGAVVFAATPGQSTKKYHFDTTVRWQENQIPGNVEGSPDGDAGNKPGIITSREVVCRIPQIARRPDGSKWCGLSKTGRYVVLSDLFYCRKGDDLAFYRGVWEGAAVLQNWNTRNPMANSEEEHVLTSSLGRGDTNRVVEGFREFVAGPTYPQEKSRFLFFLEATEADILQIDGQLEKSAGPRGLYVRCPNGLFAVRADGGCR